MAAKAATATAKETTAATAIDYAEGGRRAEVWLRLAREWVETKERDPHDGQIVGKGAELTAERDRAFRELRQWLDPTIDAEQLAERAAEPQDTREPVEGRGGGPLSSVTGHAHRR